MPTIPSGGNRRRVLFVAETSMPYQSSASLCGAQSAKRISCLKLGTELVWTGTTQLSGTDGAIHRLHPSDVCWSASRLKRSAFTTFLREEIGVELQERG